MSQNINYRGERYSLEEYYEKRVEGMKLHISFPAIFVSVNSQYAKKKAGKFYMTEEAETYKNTVRLFALQQARAQQWKCVEDKPIAIEVFYTMKNNKKDVHNDKITFDALEGIAYKNDRQIQDFHLHKRFGTTHQTDIYIAICKELMYN